MSKSVYDDVHALVAHTNAAERTRLALLLIHAIKLVAAITLYELIVDKGTSLSLSLTLITFAPTQSANEHDKQRAHSLAETRTLVSSRQLQCVHGTK